MPAKAPLLAGAAALLLAACATAEPPTASGPPANSDCFRAVDVNGFGIVDDHNVRLRVGPGREYIATIRRDTDDLDWSQALAITGPDWICVGNGMGVALVGGVPQRRHLVTRIVRAPTEEAPSGS
jgi:hypothetical protein